MEPEELIIHIEWCGPHTIEEVSQFNGTTDFGIYQIYGGHPVYGTDALLYIGLAEQRPFAIRIPEHGWCDSNQDSGRLQVHIGRLIGLSTPDNATWCRYIRLAERLLIHAHLPAKNSQKELKSMGSELRRVHVVNWRQYRSLQPEVSGARWTDRFDNIPFGSFFNTNHFPKPTNDLEAPHK